MYTLLYLITHTEFVAGQSDAGMGWLPSGSGVTRGRQWFRAFPRTTKHVHISIHVHVLNMHVHVCMQLLQFLRLYSVRGLYLLNGLCLYTRHGSVVMSTMVCGLVTTMSSHVYNMYMYMYMYGYSGYERPAGCCRDCWLLVYLREKEGERGREGAGHDR